MAKVEIVLHSKNIDGFLKTTEMKRLMEEYAETVQNRAGDGYEVTTYTGKSRVNATVAAVTADAKRDAYENNGLLKALGGGNG